MAHRSKKKHVKHVHEHETEPAAKAPRRRASSRDASTGRRFASGAERKRGPSARATARPGAPRPQGRSRRVAREAAGGKPTGGAPRSRGARAERVAKRPGLVRRLARAARDRTAKAPPTAAAVKGPGLVRALARKATRTLAAQPRKVIDRAKDRVASRVRSWFGEQ